MADLSVQVQLQQQSLKLLNDITKAIKEQNKYLSTQADLSQTINENLSSPTVARNTRDMTSAMRGAAGSAKEMDDAAKDLSSALNESADAADKLKKKSEGLSGIAKVLGSAFKTTASIFTGVGSTIFGMIAPISRLAVTILSFPFKLWRGLVKMAQRGGGGGELARAYEDVREVFGDLSSGPGKAVIDTFKNLRAEGSDLAGTGLSIRRIYGIGMGGVAAALKDLSEIAQAAGDNFSKLQNDFVKMGAKVVIFQKGLGIAKEDFAGLMSIAKNRGQDTEKFLTEFSKTAVLTAKEFGLGVKDMAKGMTELSKDVSTFGHLGPKAFAPITVYARKLGLEIKDMAGVMQKFSGFADTTEAASKLSQAFGVNVDSMQLMSAQNPAEKIDILRDAFAATGQDLSKFNYQQRQYLEQLTGLKDKSLEAAFGLKNQGVGYKDLAKQTDKANKKQISQQKVLQELSKNIKRIIPSGGGQQVTGFFDAFVKGFQKGFRRSKQFRKVLRNIRKGLKIFKNAGIQTAKAFIKYFPGVEKMLTGLTDLLSPKKMEKMAGGMVGAFKQLFKDLKHDPEAGVASFIDKMKDLFADFFNSSGAAVTAIKEGGKAFLKALSGLFAAAIKAVKPMIVDGIRGLIELIKDPSKIADMAATGTGFIAEVFGPIVDALMGGGPEGSILLALKDLFATVFEKLKPYILPMLGKLASLFGKTFGMSIAAQLAKHAIVSAGKGIMSLMGSMVSRMTMPSTGPPGDPNQVKTFGEIMREVANLSIKAIFKAAAVIGAITLTLVPVVIAMAGAARLIADWFADVPVGDVLKSVIVTTAMTGLTIALVKASNAVGDVDKSKLMKAGVTLVAAGVLVGALGGLGALVARAYEGVEASAVGKALLMTTGLTALAVGVAAAATLLAPTIAAAPLMIVGGKALALSGVFVLALGGLGALIALAYEDINPTVISSAMKMTAVLSGLAVGVAMAALAIGAVVVGSFGLGALAIVAGIAMLGTVAAGIAVFARDFVDKFKGMSTADLINAQLAADVALKVVKAASIATVAAMQAGLASALSWLPGMPDPEDGLETLTNVFKVFNKYLPSIIKNLLQAVKGHNAEEVKHATELMFNIMKAMQPMIDLQKGALMFAGLSTLTSGDNEKLSETFESISEFVSGPMKHVETMLTSIQDMSKGMSKSQTAATGAMAQMLGSMGSFLGAILGPVTKLMDVATSGVSRITEDGTWTDTYQVMQEFDIVKFHLAMTSLGEVIPGLVESIVTSMGKMIKETPDNLPTAAEAKDFASRLKPAAETLGILAKAISAFMKLGTGPALKELQGAKDVANVQKAVGKLVQSMNIIFFGAKTGTVTTSGELYDIKLEKVDPTEGIFSVIKTMLSKTKSLPKMSEADAKALANTAGSAASVLGLIGKALKIMVGGTGGIPEDVRKDSAAKTKYLQDIAGFIQESLPKIATSMGTMIDTLIDHIEVAFSGKTVSPGMEKKIKNVVAAFKIFDPIVGLVSSMSRIFKTDLPSLPDEDGKIKTFADKASETIKTIMGSLFGEEGKEGALMAAVEAMFKEGGIIDKVKIDRSSTKKVKNISLAFDAISAIAGVMKSLSNMFKGKDGAIDASASGRMALGIQTIGFVLPIFAAFAAASLTSAVTAFEKVPKVKEINAVAAKLDAFTPVIDKLKSVNADLVKFNEEAQNVAATVFAEGTPVNAVLDAVKTFGAAKGAKVKVQHSIKNARLNMQFTIKLDGKKVGAQIFEAGKIDAGNAGKGKWFVATSDFNGRNIAKKE